MILFVTISSSAQSNQELKTHYKKYYKQMQSQGTVTSGIDGYTLPWMYLNMM